MECLNDLLGYPNRKIYQNTDWFAFSLDSVLLANFVTILPRTKTILDIGTGTAPIPLILSLNTKAKIVGIEVQEDLAHLALKSVQYNQLDDQISIVQKDVQSYAEEMESDSFDVIVSNPPYFKVEKNNFHNQDLHKTLARHEVALSLEELFQCVRKLLKNDGVFAMVHRPERLLEILDLYRQYGLEPKKIQLVYPKEGKDAHMVLIEGVKHGKPGLRLLAPLIIHDSNNQYTQEYKDFIKEGENEPKEL